MTDSTQLRFEQDGERWQLTGTDARRFELVNDYLGYLADRNYSPRPGRAYGYDLEIAVAEYIDWFNHRRLHGEIDLVPPVEFEAQHHHTTPAQHPAPREIHVSIKPGT